MALGFEECNRCNVFKEVELELNISNKSVPWEEAYSHMEKRPFSDI
jgi:hypothetical protein